MTYKKGQYVKVNYKNIETLAYPVCQCCDVGYPDEMRQQIPDKTIAKIQSFSSDLGYFLEGVPPWYFCEHMLLPLDNDEMEAMENDI